MNKQSINQRREQSRKLVAARRARIREAGFVKAECYVHPDYTDLVKEYAAKLNEHALQTGKVKVSFENL